LVTLRWPSGGHCRGGRPFLSYYLHPKLTRWK
jgi:alkylation response protein AidB-like acyl-CoA dehydrogenase